MVSTFAELLPSTPTIVLEAPGGAGKTLVSHILIDMHFPSKAVTDVNIVPIKDK